MQAKHVISLQGKLNGLCSTDCFTKFKEKNQLAFSLCSQCSALCSNQKMMRSIEIEGKVHRFCSMRCFKMKLKRSMSTIACAACKVFDVFFSSTYMLILKANVNKTFCVLYLAIICKIFSLVMDFYFCKC